ncbi:MAG: choice-of-anchor I family protein [Bacteroidia bacterium]|nr:choice-of-anchor I family protein [Bacteroidia bacterium]
MKKNHCSPYFGTWQPGFVLAITILCFCVFENTLKGQTTIYSTDFGTVANINPSGWTFTGSGMNISTNNSSSGYTGASGGACLGEGNSVTFTNTAGNTQTSSPLGTSEAILQISTIGYSNVAVSFGMRKSSSGYNSNATYTLDWSSDGTNYTSIIYTEATAGSWGLVSGSGLTLPAGAANQSTLYLRWTFVRTGSASNFKIDDVTITGNIPVIVPATISFFSNDTTVLESVSSASVFLKLTSASSASSAISITASAVSSASSGDYTLGVSTVTFAANSPLNSTAPVVINLNDDLIPENTEYIILTLTNPQNAIAGATSQFAFYIGDNDKAAPLASNALTLNLLSSFSNGTSGSNSAEIVAHDPGSQRLFIANSIGAKLDIVDFVNPSSPSLILSVPISTYGNINSVAVKNGIVACAIENGINPQDSGKVVFFDVNGVYQNQVKVGMMPDMITFNHAGTKVLTANEGEPNQAYTNDPDGSISVINIAGGISSLTQTNVSHITFTTYNGQENTLRSQGIRIYGSGASASKDFEPEYITVSPDDSKAWVSLQENNAIVEIDLSTNAINYIKALGTKNHALAINPMDMSNVTRSVNIANFPVKGFYLPDAIASYTVGGVPYVISANEGDSRAYSGFSEEKRISQVTLDPTKFPNGNELKNNYLIGRLNITDKSGDIDNDGDIDTIYSYGSRSFSIWNANTGVQVYDSKDDFEQITAANSFSVLFNASNSNNTKKDRSDDKGPEPEGVTIGTIGSNTYAFIALERVGGVMVYDVTTPGAPTFVTYVNNRTNSSLGPDLGAEGIIFIPQSSSPNGMHIVIAANEVSSSLSIWGIPGCSSPLSSSLSITGATLNACSGNAPVLSVASATGITYQWTQNGSSISGATNNSLAVTSSGNYAVSINGGTNCATSSITKSLTVNPSPTISVSGNTAVCAGSSITQTISGANTYSWNGSATSSVITLTPSTSGQYTIAALASNNCSASVTRSIIVNNLPTLTVSPANTTICSGQTASLSVSGASNYSWSSGSTATVLNTAPTTNTSYVVSGTNTAGCSNTAIATVSVNALPSIIITPSSQAICIGASATFTGSGAATYSWNNGSTNAILQNATSTNTTFILTGTNSAGCTNTALATVSVNALPTIVISPLSQSVCAGSAATFTGSGASSYSWSTGSTNAVLQNTPASNTTYVLSGTNTAGCTNSASASVVVNPLPVVSFSLSTPTICVGESATITATGANTYSWALGGTSSTLAVNPSTTTVYMITGYSSANCTTTAQVTQNVNVCTAIDKQNDEVSDYVVFPNPTSSIIKVTFGHNEETEIKIVSVAGTVVYQYKNYISGSEINCELLSKGIYFVQVNTVNKQVLKKLIVE